jgi:predicted metal-dependent hydrolase
MHTKGGRKKEAGYMIVKKTINHMYKRINNLPFHFTLKPSKTAKNLKITINSKGEVILTKPWFIPEILATRFLSKHTDWVIQKLNSTKSKSSINNNEIFYRGKKFSLKFTNGKLEFKIEDNNLIVSSYSHASGKRALLDKLKLEAKKEIKDSAKKFSKMMDVSYLQIRLKDQSSRWGSCSSKNNLNFSWRLIMAPPQVLEYVVIHELAHLKYMDHSHHFWLFVEKFDPEYRTHRRWLKRNQEALISFF